MKVGFYRMVMIAYIVAAVLIGVIALIGLAAL